MKYEAVIFDLFGTLIDNFGGGFVDALEAAGLLDRLIGGRRDEFDCYWSSSDVFTMRITGIFPTATDAVRHICEQMGVTADPGALAGIQQVRMDYTRGAFVFRPDTIETIQELRQMQLSLGLMTVCTGEEALLWAKTPLAPLFDEAVFSCDVGLNKPDPRFYEITCDRLGVRPDECLYVGDAGGRELSGAKAAGMDAVLICAPHEEDIVMAREEARNWPGERISAIPEVLGLIDGRRE